MTRKSNLADALHKAASPKEDLLPEEREGKLSEPRGSSSSATPPSRQGKKAVTGHFDPLVSRQLKELALEHDTTVQALLAEAVNQLFEKYGKKPIA